MVKKPGIKLGLGDTVCCAANLDSVCQVYSDMDGGKGWIRGTREQLLEVLYYIESCPAAWTCEGQDPIERSAVLRTIASWRSKLGLGPNDKVPVPVSAGGEI